MFSINQSTPAHSRELQSPLHSTMFSIIPDGVAKSYYDGLSLHSTMFSINPSWALQDPYQNRSLHSTMFSINRLRAGKGILAHAALHSTMFSINPVAWSGMPLPKVLYIPLCFLLIGNETDIQNPEKSFTFHYVFY